jgi:type I restriction enzyme S subunit
MTNILWLGEISKHWNKKRVKDVTEINISNKNKNNNEEITFLPMTLVNSDGSYNINNKQKTKEYSSGFTYFEKNDVILAKITPCFENKKSAVLDLIETKKGYGSTEFHVFRTNRHFLNKFMLYLFKTDAFIDFGVSNFKGSAGHKRVPFEIINSMEVPAPSIKEQTAIANYLDKKTSSIDDSIETLKSQKERLIEQKKAIIHKAVTKGLGNSAKNWKLFRLKDKVNIKTGNSLNQEQKEFYSLKNNNSYSYVGSRNIDLISSKIKNISFFIPNKNVSNFKLAKKGTSLLCIEGGSAGRKITKLDKDYCYVNKLANFDSKKVNNSYIYYYLQSSYFKSQFKRDLSGMIGGVSINNLKLMTSFFPSIIEQEKIVKHLDIKISKIDEAVNEVDKQIGLLNEYKKTLINDVVTGKVKVL